MSLTRLSIEPSKNTLKNPPYNVHPSVIVGRGAERVFLSCKQASLKTECLPDAREHYTHSWHAVKLKDSQVNCCLARSRCLASDVYPGTPKRLLRCGTLLLKPPTAFGIELMGSSVRCCETTAQNKDNIISAIATVLAASIDTNTNL